MMFWTVVIVMLHGQPKDLPQEAFPSVAACSIRGEQIFAEWLNAHPDGTLVRWGCSRHAERSA